METVLFLIPFLDERSTKILVHRKYYHEEGDVPQRKRLLPKKTRGPKYWSRIIKEKKSTLYYNKK